MGFPCGPAGKESSRNARDLGSIPGLGRSPGEGKGCPLQYSGLYSLWGLKEWDTTERFLLHNVIKEDDISNMLEIRKENIQGEGDHICPFTFSSIICHLLP